MLSDRVSDGVVRSLKCSRPCVLENTSGDRHVSPFLRAVGEIAGAREMYGRVANHWDRRLAQVRALANGVGSHAAE
jgi:hypothetical protein